MPTRQPEGLSDHGDPLGSSDHGDTMCRRPRQPVGLPGGLEPKTTKRLLRKIAVLRRPGGYCEEPEPDPIPNSAVKLLSADGTMS